MPAVLNLKPTSKPITAYYAALEAYARQRVKHEGALRSAFQNLLTEVGKSVGWTLIPELTSASVRPDGTFRDAYYLEHGYWEAKDTQDKLEAEIQKKIAKGYPLTNTIFEDTRKAYLYQNKIVVLEADLTQPQQLITLLVAFFSYTIPAHEDFNKAVEDFRQRVPDLARGLVEKLSDAHKNNARFIGYSVKVADTHGIVYTPQPLVDFMCASVAEVLQTEFGKGLGGKDVTILDPCTGTGNFIVNLLRRIPKRDLPRLYREQMFANEVMLLPYYIAALNIEHAYFELTGEYEPFEGLCFVDTLDLAESAQSAFSFMTEENTARVQRQKKAPITVIIGNPPYNVGQINENDNNKNRKYPEIDARLRETYAQDSQASSVNKLSDAYVKFFRWATDRLQERDGVVCFFTNNGFVGQVAFDGMRKHLLQDFTRIYHIDLHGNVRENPKLSGTTHNVFGIQVGVGVTVAVRNTQHPNRKFFYHRVPEDWRKEEKFSWLIKTESVGTVKWRQLKPDARHNWLIPEGSEEFYSLLPLGSREAKSAKASRGEVIFKTFSIGVNTNRDSWVYSFRKDDLEEQIKKSIETYNGEIDRWKRANRPKNIDDFVTDDPTKIKWSSRLKETLLRKVYAQFAEVKIRNSLYRPFTREFLFFDSVMNHRQAVFPQIFPVIEAESENRVMIIGGYGRKEFSILTANVICDLNFYADPAQCFPFYIYDEDGSNRRENITDWALSQFRDHYSAKEITKWDVFYYVYGILHHPGYCERFADNLKRDLPRIPFAADFYAFAEAGKKLAQLHLDYEKLEPYPLKWTELPDLPLSYRVEKMRLRKEKTSLQINESLTLAGIPPETFLYRLGNRSALEWIVDQYQVSKDKRSGIKSDPNRSDDKEYIVRLVG